MANNEIYFSEQNPKLLVQGLYDESATQKHRLGTRIRLSDGREFVYTQAGASNLLPGKVNVSPAPVTNHTNCALSAAAVLGATTIIPTLGATAATLNQYAEGFAYFNDDGAATGEGQCYKVKSSPVNAGSLAASVVLYDELREVTTTASEVSLIANPYDGVLVAPATTLTGAPVGVATFTVTALYYFWMQVFGPCPVLTEGTLVLGQNAQVSLTTAGSVGPVAETSSVEPVIGHVLSVNATTEYSLIFLRL
jgi:hypothetical protein